MSKGIISPWNRNAEASPQQRAQALAEQRLDDSIEGAPRQQVIFDGRALQFIVGFYTFERDPQKLWVFAHDALGRALEGILKADRVLGEEFKRQSIYLDPTKVLAAKVTIKFGPITLYVKASSYDEKMAKLMALDRIALAVLDAQGVSPKIRQALVDYDLKIARKT